MQFTTTFFALSAAILAAATPMPNEPISQCNTGDAQCCNSVTSASDPSTAALLGLLGIVLQSVDILIGTGCTPITVIGVGSGANCAQQPVCCTDNNFNGLVNVGCSPISL
ncbi:hypothetical protein M422DRAFT_273964 [Sphaerobolus stellatus SS14]|uniref:Hydrophobin n=1 Tax=Sphaerobolus stellatus (strain SS14) TaxID=990650 RepID=A0A0C9U7P0_SPHS4|nr:hypothetical protein M422DRAFT_273964 [Sphaerobolus stellatus SS14]